ncbi:allophanate hydrolase-related protein [Embleya scabrispora]|uniref:allophanate hydrolase-related protein n=1 Tax=Embleya scabrispora TaxID=159449 RepID=UPI00035C2AE6|nr:gamma-glutamylcyclotransferase [Embleya scabrispora]MYS82908.1 gamma-glutamylcyclotransferase [Streptomyces sp. SID5474]
MARMFLNGQAMEGGPFHHHLDGAPLLAKARTAPGYRFFSIGDRCPGLLPDPASEAQIAGEVYEVPDEVLRDNLLPTEPAELEFGIIKLEDGSACFSMILRRGESESGRHKEITEFGGWRAYLRTLGREV